MIYAFAGYELDTSLFELRHAGRRVPLEPQVFDLLAYLVENSERVVTKDELFERLWPEGYVTDATLNSRIMAARKAVGDSGREQRFIRTLQRRGYRFIAPVERNDAALDSAHALERVSQRIAFCRTSQGVRIAYAVAGEGPVLVKAANWLSHLEFDWQSPVWRHWIAALAAGRQLVRYDEQGCGLSDWSVPDISFETWVESLESVIEELGLGRFALFGMSQGAASAIAYAVAHPERVSRLVIYGGYARGWQRRNPSPQEVDERDALLTLVREGWGREDPAYRKMFASWFIPEATSEQADWFSDLCRVSTSPANAVRLMEEFGRVDVEALLPDVSVPTLVLHARGDQRAPYDEGLRIARSIPGARFVPIDSANHILLESEPGWRTFVEAIDQFLASPGG